MKRLVMASLLVTGCGVGTPAVELGTTDSEFQPFEEGAAVSLQQGPQGGYHVWLAMRIRDLDPFNMRVSSSLSLDDGSMVSGRIDLVDLERTAQKGVGLQPGIPLLVPNPDQVHQRWCVVTVHALDRQGHEAAASLRIFVR